MHTEFGACDFGVAISNDTTNSNKFQNYSKFQTVNRPKVHFETQNARRCFSACFIVEDFDCYSFNGFGQCISRGFFLFFLSLFVSCVVFFLLLLLLLPHSQLTNKNRCAQSKWRIVKLVREINSYLIGVIENVDEIRWILPAANTSIRRWCVTWQHKIICSLPPTCTFLPPNWWWQRKLNDIKSVFILPPDKYLFTRFTHFGKSFFVFFSLSSVFYLAVSHHINWQIISWPSDTGKKSHYFASIWFGPSRSSTMLSPWIRSVRNFFATKKK